MVETLSSSTMVDHAESWFHATRVIVTLFARKAREWRSRADTVRTPVVFSASHIVIARQSVVVCPGSLASTVTILLNSNIPFMHTVILLLSLGGVFPLPASLQSFPL